MTLNRQRPHLLILPEDDANREMANGFLTDDRINNRVIQVLPNAGGTFAALDWIANHNKLRQFPNQRVLLLIDLADVHAKSRYDERLGDIPAELKDRIFILGVLPEPEPLATKHHISKEQIGRRLAAECAEGRKELWNDPSLAHNEGELSRLTSDVKPFLFLDPSPT